MDGVQLIRDSIESRMSHIESEKDRKAAVKKVQHRRRYNLSTCLHNSVKLNPSLTSRLGKSIDGDKES